MEAQTDLRPIWENEFPSFSFTEKFFARIRPVSKAPGIPKIIRELCNGIRLGQANIKSLLFSTDIALIENTDTDAVLAVYPFAPSPRIMKTLIGFSEKPVICGVGGGRTQGKASLEMAIAAEDLGAVAIIVNQPFKNRHIEAIKRRVNIPLISSIAVKDFFFSDRINAGVDIFHVTGGERSAEIIECIRYAALAIR